MRDFTRSKVLLISGILALGAMSVISACTNSQAKSKLSVNVKEPTKAGILVTINGEDLTEDQLMGDNKTDFQVLYEQEYSLRMDRLKSLIIDKIGGVEAKKANMSLPEFIEKKIIAGKDKANDSDMKGFLKARGVPESQLAQLNPEQKERVKQLIGMEKRKEVLEEYAAKLSRANKVDVYFKRKEIRASIDLANAPLTRADAPVTVVEFSDFQCPFCSKGADRVAEIKSKYGSKVKVAFKHFPLPNHPNARPAAEASMCVNEQGTEKFWKFHDLVFKNQDKMDEAGLANFAKQAGAKEDAYKACVAAGKYRDLIGQDMAYGEKIGVESTPTFFVNGRVVKGAVDFAQFAEIIDDELASKKN